MGGLGVPRRRSWGNWFAAAAVSLVVTLAFSQGAKAEVADSTLEPAYNAAFERMLHDPSNLDVIFDYARLAAQIGDMEGAIGAYERMLIYNPDLPTVRYELGRLYYLINSYAFADTYFQRALTEDTPPDIRAEIARYRAEIARRLSSSQFSGSFGTGFKYQSNPTATPSAVRVFGLDTSLDSQFRKRGDFNFYVNGDVLHVYDFKSQSGIVLETAVIGYAAQQFRATDFSLAAFEATPGVRIPVINNQELPNLSVRPYFIGDFVALGYVPFYNAIGGGGNIRSSLTPQLQINVDSEYRRRSFTNTNKNPTLSLMDSNLILSRVTGNYLLGTDDSFGLSFQYTRNRARALFQSYNEYSIYGVYSHLFQNPGKLTGTDWIASVSGGVAFRPYDQPDFTIDPGATRYDNEWNLAGTLAIGITTDVAAVIQVQQLWQASTIPNFRYTNTTALAGVRFVF
jgi:hypothetical protein